MWSFMHFNIDLALLVKDRHQRGLCDTYHLTSYVVSNILLRNVSQIGATVTPIHTKVQYLCKWGQDATCTPCKTFKYARASH